MKDRAAIFCLLLYLLLMGMGQIFLTPPFEGLDEIAHHAGLRQVAARGTIPLTGSAYLDKMAEDYRAKGPFPYSAKPPFEKNGGLTYPAFFARPELAADFQRLYREAASNKPFEPGHDDNWQTQHPPLYYVFMAPFVRATQGLSFLAQFFALRVVSYLFVVGGLLIALAATLRFMRREWAAMPILFPASVLGGSGGGDAASFPRARAFLGPEAQRNVLFSFLFYPAFFPQFFPEFARLGNDSLCVLLVCLLWAFLLRWLENEKSFFYAFAVGVTLAAGLLTKAFFLPLTVGVGAFLLYRLWRMRGDRPRAIAFWDAMVMTAGPVVLGLFWYVYKWRAYGNFVGAQEYALLAERGGLAAAFAPETIKILLAAPYQFFATFVWGGSTSQGHMAGGLFLFPVFCFFFVTALYLDSLFATKPGAFFWIPVWVLVPVLAAFLQHLPIGVVLRDVIGGTPGWYLHVYFPFLAFAFALGWGQLRFPLQRFVAGVWILYIALFQMAALWAQMSLCAGFSLQSSQKLPIFSAFPFDLPLWRAILARHEIMSWPHIGLTFIALSYLFLGAGFALFGRKLPEKGRGGVFTTCKDGEKG